jgi:methylated-DNA-[protein]-cysteine S-methyltransferase
MYYTQFDTGVCPIILIGDEKGIRRLHMVVEGDSRSMDLIAGLECKDDFFDKAKEQILDYLDGKRRDFDLKLNLVGTDFQKNVWKALLEIPYGETRTYKEIATVIGNSNASRAVGMANNKNPLPLIIPCHRVVGSKGQLTGYAFGLEIKDRLLAIENLL